MGFCGTPTHIFDAVVNHLVEHSTATDEENRLLIKVLAEVLESEDWDCQFDSDYYDHPLVSAVFKEMHPEWDDEESLEELDGD